MAIAGLAPDEDPPPAVPIAPTMGECCRGGCDPCVFEIYQDELARYEEALREWRRRHSG